ncbi:MAG TPA: FadR/GntR family transcriptional regulator [Spirochaetota bacterium]|nr:FadR/GntR family transcriptional regulator [Spirochaetota bacterium]HSA14951.1 FadR/GntR family transcriptional regulator [Spirochaetota bacterium]
MTSSPRPLVPISKSRLHEEIIGQIQDRIIKGELAPGEKLPAERDLAQSLGVNRGTVREALKKLEMLGLVEILHGDGIYVKNYLECGNLELLKSIIYSSSTMTAGIIKNLLELRRILAPEMAAAAAANRSEEDAARMKKIIASDEQSVLERDLAIHSAIARAAKNLPYVFILNFNNQVFRDFGHIYFDDAENRERSKKFHRDITAAIAGRKQDEARKIMRDVLAYTDRKIDEYYKIAPTKRRAGGNS